MLSPVELGDLLVRFGLPQAGRRLVKKAREESPVRKVKSSGGNVVTHYFSKKMNRVISTESHTAEQVGAYLYEFDPHVIEYWPQPVWLDLLLTHPSTGRKGRKQHCPDFLVITDECIYLDEWKQANHLLALSLEHPERFKKEGNEWRSPLLEGYCDPLGISYRVHSPEHVSHQRLANQKFLADFLDPECPESSKQAVELLMEWFREEAEIPLAMLINEAMSTECTFSPDDIYRAIAIGQLCIDMDESEISDTERVLIYRDELSMRLLRQSTRLQTSLVPSQLAYSIATGSKIGFNGKVFDVVVGTDEYILRDGQGVVSLKQKDVDSLFAQGKLTLPHHQGAVSEVSYELHSLSPKQMAEIEKRMEAIRVSDLPGGVSTYSARSIRRFKKKIREAGEEILNQNLALVSRSTLKGNRRSKISEEMINLINKVGDESHNKPGGPPKTGSYAKFVSECHALNIKPCSMKTFSRHLRVSVVKREGRRRAYQEAPIVWYLHAREPIHGVRPFEIVHIDTTPLELVLRGPWGKESLGIVHLCEAIDAESRSVLAFHLSFDKPSYKTTMMVLRDMVCRHGRMAETLVVDQGPENRTLQLFRVCRLCGTNLRQRPAGEPRGGTVLERHFGVTHTQFIHLLDGNSKIRKHYRSVTKSVRPENFASWTLPALHGALDEYFHKVYGSQPHPAHGEPPDAHLDRRLKETGERCHRMVKFDRLFMIETCPAASGTGTREVDGKRGIKADYIWYWSDKFQTRGLHGKLVEVRVDPWDPGVVFALVDNTWVECVSKYRQSLRFLTWVELRYIINNLRAMLSVKKLPLTEERIAAQLRLLDPKNFDPRLRLQQEEARIIYEALGTAAVNGAPDHSANPFIRILPTLAEMSSSEPVVEKSLQEIPSDNSEVEVFVPEIVNLRAEVEVWDFNEDFGLI